LGWHCCNDECGVCDGDKRTCADCAGFPNGDNVVDNCGTCDADSSNDCTQDCVGQWGGSAEVETFYLDIDGDGLGSGTGYELCNGLDLTGWVSNNDDSDDNCASNEHDCAGVCDGSSVVDECGECGGDGIDEGACDCAGNVDDCAGECGGSAVVDECGECGGDGIDEGACDCAGSVEDCSGSCLSASRYCCRNRMYGGH